MRYVLIVPHFRDENKTSDRLSRLSKIPQLERGRTKTPNQDYLIPKSRLFFTSGDGPKSDPMNPERKEESSRR